MSSWVLLRGLTREARHWGDFPEKLSQRLGSGASVATIDLPGNGALCDMRSPRDIAEMTMFCRETLRARNIDPPYYLVALSLGGMVAAQWCAQFEKEVGGCVLINSSAGDLNPFWQRTRPGSYVSLLRIVLSASGRTRERLILRLTSASEMAEPALLDRWTQYAVEYPVTRRNTLNQLLAAMKFRAPAIASAVPLLVLASNADKLVNPACSRALANRWRAPLVVHPHAGHDLPLDDGAWLIDQVAQWANGRCHLLL